MAKENIEKLLYFMNQEAKKLKEANSPVVFLYDKIVDLENKVEETFSNLENKISIASKGNELDTEIQRIVTKIARKLVDIEKGDKGENGKDGYTPIKGVDYFDGYTPVKGKDYFDGLNGKDGYTPIKGIDYFDGVSIDENIIIKNVLEKITIPSEQLRDKLEALEGDERLDQSAIKGLDEKFNDITRLATAPRGIVGSGSIEVFNSIGKVGSGSAIKFLGSGVSSITNDGHTSTVTIEGGGGGHTIQDEGVSLTQRTNLNFVGAGVTVTDDAGNDATVVTISTSAGAGYQAPTSGTVNGTNVVFTWAVAPNALSVDGQIIRKTASDGTTNWSGTTTTTLTIAPNFDVFGIA